jgi:3'-phosphoadenosine 5'-phosphosulfate sulfotransferase (PAPS reductase)/FAD synthetase
MEKKKLVITFSGGRTSGYMLWWMYNEWPDRDNWDKIAIFTNTGKEAEGTLFFVDECAAEWGIDIIWLEGYPSEIGKGYSVKHKIVSYERASRKGEPFEALIKKLGIPFSEAPFCSRQLKKETILDYLRHIGWKKHYTAIGIRSDEQNRISKTHIKNRIIYPLAQLNPVTKSQIKLWWDKQSFDLDIHPDDGNCVGCWKKSFPTLSRIMNRNPDTFTWWQEMIDKYGASKHEKYIGVKQSFYRGNKSIEDIRILSKINQAELKQLDMYNQTDGCTESCESF